MVAGYHVSEYKYPGEPSLQREEGSKINQKGNLELTILVTGFNTRHNF